MSLKANQRGKLLLLQRFLEENTDAEHPATMEQILQWLDTNAAVGDRRTVYEDLGWLRDQGLDIQSVRMGRGMGYYIGSRAFALSELKLLVDAVQSSKFITESKSMSLIGRIEKLGSVHQARQLRHQVWVRGRIKTMNESIFANVDRISAAIESNKQITFRYFTWNVKRERVFRRDGARYEASPWALLLDNENYYLLAWEGGTMKHFRVDKMLDIRVAERPREGRDAFGALNMAAYTDSHFGMFSGEIDRVKLCFLNSLAGVAIDQFGPDAMLIPYDEEHFTVTIRTAVNVQFFAWLLGLGDGVRILEPQSAIDAMKAHLDSVRRLYGE
jgi:predicted DNA-binding transcriptional regulator YafY